MTEWAAQNEVAAKKKKKKSINFASYFDTAQVDDLRHSDRSVEIPLQLFTDKLIMTTNIIKAPQGWKV